MVTLSFIILALLPIVAPSLIALLGLVLLCCAPTVRIEESAEVVNAEALELGLDVVESVLRLDRPCIVPCPVTLRSVYAPVEPTMADMFFAGMNAHMSFRDTCPAPM